MKKIRRLVMAFLAAAMMISTVAMPASAATRTHIDQSYQFTVSNSKFEFSAKAEKDDRTSSYIYYKSGNTQTASFAIYSDPDYVNRTQNSKSVKMTKGMKYFVQNTVKEAGKDWARLWGSSAYGQESWVGGYWSPDSVWESGILEV